MVHSRPRRAAFTLIELLVVIVILGILGGLVFGALSSATQRAKIAKTKATIAKLNTIIMRQYESYFTRRLPTVDVTLLFPGMTPLQKQAAARVNALRDLMRMEMPDRWTDVKGPGEPGTPLPLFLYTPYTSTNVIPSVTLRYRRLYDEAVAAVGAGPVAGFASAECLYMIVMSDPENAEQFQPSEIGDFDRDGLPEFHDAWGHPIRFIRWPAGFIEYTNLQHWAGVANGPAGAAGGPSLPWSTPSDVQSGAYDPTSGRATQPDPFDPRGILAAQGGYALFPLIYSAGPDGIYDINVGIGSTPGSSYSYELDALYSINPYLHDKNTGGSDADGHTFRYVGQPLDSDNPIDGSPFNGVLDHYDNIHNQRIETKQ